jgi:hypothetical protein
MSVLTLPQKIPLSFVAQAFSELFPIQSLIHVGYGSGRGGLSFWRQLSPKSVFLIDAHEIVSVPKSDDYSVKCVKATLSAEGGTRNWTHSQLASEDSLLSDKAILSRWPHVKGLGVKSVDTLTLDNLISIEDIHGANWLLIDCNPAHEVLSGASSLLADIEVVVLRGYFSDIEAYPSQSRMESLRGQLNKFGLKLVYLIKQDNDLTIDALFVRFDYKDRLTVSIESSHHSLQLACEELNQSIEDQTALTRRLQALKVERDQLLATAEAATQEVGAMKARSSELEQDRTALTKSLLALKVERDQLQINVDSYRIELESSKLQLIENQKQFAETRLIQQMLDEEMIKAEAQIELIKDLLLREPDGI